MLFSSATFLFGFLPVVLAVYYALRGHRETQNTVLCLFSLFFYAWGEPWFVLIMLVSIIVNWAAGLLIERSRSKLIVVLDLVFNLGILAVFKYLMFAVESVNDLLGTDMSVPDIALPIGISFFTFQAISYVLDVYRGHGAAQHNILHVALYISFFPQLIAGPIVRYNTISEQITDRHESWEDFSEGCVRFIIGLGKKIIIANNLALIADKVFEMASGVYTDWFGIECSLTADIAWLGALAYTFQIFFDFSGYSDMAIGLGKMFGFHFLENFNYPYISGSISEFWRRWHISLGTWFRDYLYIPLGGSHCSQIRNYLNLLVVWFCTGLWHGANTTFIIWGLMYFVLIAAERYFDLKNRLDGTLSYIGHIYTLLFVVIGWVIFRADNMHVACNYIAQMFSFTSNSQMAAFYIREYWMYYLVAVIFSVPIIPRVKAKISRRLWDVLSGAIVLIVLIVSISFIVKGSYNPFIYFNF